MTQSDKLYNALKRGWVSPLHCFNVTGSLSFSRRRNDVQKQHPQMRLESRWKTWKGKRFKEWRVERMVPEIPIRGVCR